MKNGFVLALLIFGAAGHGTIVLAQSPGTFTATANMTTPRGGHTATLLTNGKVLIAGGVSQAFSNSALATAELYDPDTRTFSPIGDMTAPRSSHTATLLPDGRVLIAGGVDNDHVLNTAEVYDPSTGTFAQTHNTIRGQDCVQANLLSNGKVLLSGGSEVPGDYVPDAQLYDPLTGSFADAGPYSTNPSGFNTCQGAASTLLPDGKVLIVWEEDGATEIYHPDTGTFAQTGKTASLSYNDGLPTATLLMNGKVLVAGGMDDSGIHRTAELYDSGTGAFTAAGNTLSYHVGHTGTLLPDGTVLLAGSFEFPSALTNAELYDSVTGLFTATGSLITARGFGQTATLLNNGQVLITGGFSPYPAITSNAEIYHPVLLVPAPQLRSVSGERQGQGAILHAGTARVVTANDPAVPGEVLEIYGTGLKDGGIIPPQVAIGGRLAEVLYFGNAPGFTGLNQVNVRLPRGIAPGAGVSVLLRYLDRSSNEVTIGVR